MEEIKSTVEAPVIRPWQSKINIVNAVFGLIAIIALFSPDKAEGIAGFLRNNSPLIDTIWAGANMVLRTFFTKSIVEVKK